MATVRAHTASGRLRAGRTSRARGSDGVRTGTPRSGSVGSRPAASPHRRDGSTGRRGRIVGCHHGLLVCPGVGHHRPPHLADPLTSHWSWRAGIRAKRRPHYDRPRGRLRRRAARAIGFTPARPTTPARGRVGDRRREQRRRGVDRRAEGRSLRAWRRCEVSHRRDGLSARAATRGPTDTHRYDAGTGGRRTPRG